VISHPLGALHHEILRRHVAICRTRGGSRHMSLVLSHLSWRDLAYLVSCFFSPMLLHVDLARPGCTSQDIGNRIDRRIRLQRLGPSTAAVQHCTDEAIETAPSMSCFLRPWVRRDIPLLRCFSTKRRQRIINTSCITGCLFGHCLTYQTRRPRLEAYWQRAHTIIITALFIESLLPSNTMWSYAPNTGCNP
jgi:hypothetical protein